MHSAPSVDYPVGRSCWWLLLWALPAAPLGWLVAERWIRIGTGTADPDAIGFGLTLAAAGWWLASIRAWWRSPSGELRWIPAPDAPSGGHWYWRGQDRAQDQVCAVRPVLDLQSAWLLRLQGDGATRWVWVESHRAPAAWDDLRRAVWASRGNPDTHDRSGIFPRA